jgi:hypothetical protein
LGVSERVRAMVLADKFGRKYLISWFPRVVCLGISLPFDQILKSPRSPEVAVAPDLFDFEFHFAFHDVRGRSREVGPVFYCFMIRGQQRRMEDVMDGPGWGQVEPIGDRRYLFGNDERSVSLRG